MQNDRRHFGVNSSLDANDRVANRDVLSHGLLKILGIELRGVIVDVYHVDSDLKYIIKISRESVLVYTLALRKEMLLSVY